MPTRPAPSPAALLANSPSAKPTPATASRRAAARRRAEQRRRPRVSRLLAWLLAAWLGHAGLALAQVAPGALPTGGQVMVGSGQLQLSPNLLVIQQYSNRLGLDWQSFNIGSGATVEFRQPGASAVALNRVVGHSGSEIYGQLRANGQVFLTNPNGVLFAPGSKVDVGGLVASTLDLSQQDFADGRYVFNAGAVHGSVINQGQLQASAGGYLALFGQRVDNQGDLSVNAGSVVLAAGRAATVSISGSGLISAVVTPGMLQGSVHNSGRITADGGVVTLSAKSAQDIAASLVNNSGIVRANTLVERGGEIWITGDNVSHTGQLSAAAPGGGDAGRVMVLADMQHGTAQVNGTLDASAAGGGNGGFVETSAARVKVGEGTRVTTAAQGARTGTWLIDPNDYTVAASGGNITGATLSANLASSNVEISTFTQGTAGNGDIFVNDAVSWASNTLTLTAERHVNVGADLNITGTGGALVMTPGTAGVYTLATGSKITFSGSQNSLQVAGVNYTLLRSIDEFQTVVNASNTTRSGNYALATDIDATATSTLNGGLGFLPVGTATGFGSSNSFRGRFDGLGHTITGLTINRPTTDNVGLFGTAHDATLRNLNFVGGSIVGRLNVGTLAGYIGSNNPNTAPTTVINVGASTPVSVATGTQTANAGGLIGQFTASNGVISRTSSSGNVTTGANGGNAGGLVGNLTTGSIDNSSASGAVLATATTNSRALGGLVGSFEGTGTLASSSATGDVSNANYAGGLVGFYGSTGGISTVSATGDASGTGYVGGLIGDWASAGAINGAQASGNATGDSYVGGLVGRGYFSGSLSNATATGNVSTQQYGGGLVGLLQQSNLGNARAEGSVTGRAVNSNTVYLGGLVGYYTNSTAGANITNATAIGNVLSEAPYGNVGGLVGQQDNGSVVDSSATGSVTANSTVSSRAVGGLIGSFNGAGTLTRVRAEGAVLGGYYVGGLVGYHTGDGLTSFATAIGDVTGNASGTQHVGGLVGMLTSGGAISDSEASGKVVTQYDGGGLIGYWISSGAITDSRATGAVTGVYGSGSLGGLVGYGNSNGGIVNSSAGGRVQGGSRAGGLVGNLLSTNVTQATASGAVSTYSDGTVYVGGLIGDFSHNSTGVQISSSSGAGNVFADAASSYVGGLVGQFSGGSITTSTATGQVVAQDNVNSSSSQYAGGLVGQFSGQSISDSAATGSVTGRFYAGGLTGYFYGPGGLNNTSATGNVVGSSYVGGLVGYLVYSPVNNGYASGSVTSLNGDYAGGLVGYSYSYYTGTTATINDSAATGNVSGASYGGGLVGYWEDYYGSGNNGVTNSRASGNVSARNSAGGLLGYFSNYNNNGTGGIRNSQASGNVDAPTYAGGLVGQFQSYGGIEDSFATGSVVGTGAGNDQYLGGLVGYHTSYNSTPGAGQILRSYATGSVQLASGLVFGTGTDVYAGGLVGYLDGPSATVVTLADSYATGSVDLTNTSGRLRAGGLVGYTDTSLSRTYATGSVAATGLSASRAIGGLVAQRVSTSVTGTDSYWATDTSGVATSALGTGVTQAALESAATYTGWDLATTGGTGQVWRIYEGLSTPLLRGLLTPLTLSLADINKVYDSNSSLGSAAISVAGTAVANPGRILVSGIAADAGSYALGAGNLYSVQNGYDLTVTGAANLVIARRQLTLDGLAANKVYDGSAAAALAVGAQPGGLVAGEDLNFLPGAGFGLQFDSRNVGTGKTVTLSGSYSIGDGSVGRAANYILPATTTTTANITPATLTAGSFTASNRAYDGSTTVAVSAAAATLTGVVGTDAVSVDLSTVSSGTVASKNAGAAKAVTVSGTLLNGADAGNYTLAGLDTLKVDITPKALTVNGITANDRQYNQGVNASLSTSAVSLSGLVSGDLVQPRLAGLTGQVADKNVGNAKAVTVSGLVLRGEDAGNYAPQAGAVSMNITPYALTLVLGTTSSTNKVYDGNTNASVYFPTRWYGGDDITVNTTSIGYADENVAYNTSGAVTGKTITASGISLSGTDRNNYAPQNTTATATGTISPKPLAVSGVSAVNRVYNGTRDVEVIITGATVDTQAVIQGDDVGVATPGSGAVMGQIANKNVGNAKPVTVPGLALTGGDAGNYSLTSSSGGGVTVNITPKPLTAVYTAQNKVYDGSIYATMNVTSADIVAGDALNFYIDASYCGTQACGYAVFTEAGRQANGSYVTSRHAGADKPVVITYNQLVGTDAGNYTLNNPTGESVATITPKPVTLAYNGVSKVYDGSATASVSLNFGSSGLYGGDTLSSTQTAVYTGTGAKNVGTGKAISVADIVLAGTHAGNYIVGNTTATTTGTVTAKPITVSGITATDRAYDGTTTVAVSAGTVGSAGFVAGDIVAVDLPPGGLSTGTIVNKNIGTNKPVTVTGLTLSGTDATNYSIDAAGSGITVNISALALTPTYAGGTQVYNGGVTASVTPTTAGIASGDVVTFTQNAVFTGASARDVGTNKPVSITNIALGGSGAANYSLASTTASTAGTITPKPVTATYVGSSRVYNGLADVSAAVVGNSLQFVAGDTVGLSQTARFTGDGGAGSNKPVAITGITLTGAQAANYSLINTTASTTATITPRPLGVTGITATDRVYDGTTTVGVNVAGASVDTANVIAGDSVSVTLPPTGISTGTMDNRDAGPRKTVNITGLTITGASAANYALIGATGLTVNIAPLSLTAVYAGVDKVYDGNVDAQVTATSNGMLAVDTGLLGYSIQGLFIGSNGRNVGTDKTVDIVSAFLTGAARDNYTLVNATGSTLADITPRPLTANYSGGTKVYDGTVTAVVTGSLSNRVAGDSVAAAQTAEFTGSGARNVGDNKPIAVSNIALTGADAGNYRLTNPTDTTTGNITRKPITVSGLNNVVATDRVYDGSRQVVVTVPAGVTLVPNSTDILQGDTVTIDVPVSGVTTGTTVTKNVGNGKAVTVDGLELGGTDAGNYSIAGTAGITVNITPRLLTAVYAGVNKVYDGSTAAGATGSSLDILGADSVGITGSGVFTGAGGKDAGFGKPLDVLTATLTGADAGNYSLVNTTGTATADITQRAINPAYTGLGRVYDGSTTAPVLSSTTGFVVGDAVTLSQTAVFTDGRNVGQNKPVQVTGITLVGSDAVNYALTGTQVLTSGNVTPKPLRIEGLTGVSAADRVYDGSTLVQVTVSSTGPIAPNPADVVGSDDVSVTAPPSGTTTGTMADKHVGTAKPVAVAGLALGGADAANYSITATSGVTVTISPKAVTAVYSAGSRVYDGSTVAAITGGSADLVLGDSVAIGATGSFTGSGARNVGTDKPVAVVAGVLTGADAANYSLLNTTGSTTGSITPKSVTAAYFGGSRIYDGSTAAPVTGTATGFITGDAVALAQTAVFSGSGARNVGDDKPVEISAITLSGSDAGNYTLLTGTASTTASIAPRPLRIEGLTGVVAADRVYDGTTGVAIAIQGTGTIAPNLADVVPGDSVGVVAPPPGTGAGTMADKHVGSNKPVTVNGLTLSGSDAGNYVVAAATGVTVNIAPLALTAVYTGQSRVYDGSAAALLVGTSADLIGGDLVTITGSGLFTGADAKNAGLGKAIAVTGGALSGADALNYSLLNPTGSTTADITPRLLTPAYAGGTRVYDGTTDAPVTLATSGLVAGDDLRFTQSAVFNGGGARNVGVDKPVAVFGITLQGTDAVNYALTSTAASTTATITPRPLNVSGLSGLQAVDRVYDGTRDVQITGSALVGTASGDVIGGDDVTITLPGGSISAGTMVDKAAGTGKAVAVAGLSLGGADAANYQITGVAGLTVNIAPRSVVLLGLAAVNRVYDGSTQVAVDSSGGSVSGVLAGDDLQLLASGVTGSMADKHVGSGKVVNVTGLSLAGADVANYTVDNGGGLRVDITPRTLVASVTAADKVYDGSNSAAVTFGDDRIAGDALALASRSATFASKDAGAAQAVNVGGLTLAGSDAGNYVLLANALGTTASIQPAPLTVSANTLSKVYGESVNLSGAEFTTLGLVAGETLGFVTLASDGTVATAAVAGSPYRLNVSDARGGTFNPANYSLTYTSGALTVTPRPLTIAANSVVRTADEDNPTSFGFSSSVGGLFGGDNISSVVLNAPAGSTTAAGGSIFELLPSGAVFGAGLASNYAISYDSGLLVVLPKPPRVDDVDPNAGNTGEQGFAVQVDQAELERALDALQRSASVVAQPGTDSAPGIPLALRTVDATAAEISVALAGDGSRITLPALLRLPLISFDPNLRRLIFGGPTAVGSSPTPPATPTAP
ncbi:MAG: YDG domain-containing protein [Rubrivivax sp.]|nr:YDG domain-containing protein [Rubrivivax sp.]